MAMLVGSDEHLAWLLAQGPQPAQLRRIRQILESYAPMKAHGRDPGDDVRGHAVEIKEDGMRGPLTICGEEIAAHGLAEFRNVPSVFVEELQQWSALYPGLKNGTLLDAEWHVSIPTFRRLWPNQSLVPVGDRRGLAMSYISSGNRNLTATCFDVPLFCGMDIRDWPWRRRRRVLRLLLGNLSNSALQISQLVDIRQPDWWERLMNSTEVEGVVIKPLDSLYGPPNLWGKRKREGEADVIVAGFAPGAGKYANGVGSVIGAQFRDGKLVEVARASGMADAQRAAFSDADIGRVFSIRFQGQTSESFQHPRWNGWRNDKLPTDCVWRIGEK